MKRRGRKPLDARDPSVTFTVRIPSRHFDALCKAAQEQRRSVPDAVRRTLRREIKKFF